MTRTHTHIGSDAVPQAYEHVSHHCAVKAMDLVFENDDDEKVKQFVARFSSSSEGASGPVEMGACPPCEGFAKLKPVTSLSQIIEKYHTCRQPKQLRDRGSGSGFGFFSHQVRSSNRTTKSFRLFNLYIGTHL